MHALLLALALVAAEPVGPPPPTIGLVYPQREPLTPLTAALVTEARRIGPGWMAER